MSVITPRNRFLVILLSSLILFSAAAVPLSGLSGAANGTDQSEAFESFEVEFKPAEPEAPKDVVVRWNLTDDAPDVDRIRIAFIGETNDTINLFKPGDTDVPNPFVVTAAADRNGSGDVVVDDLTAGTLRLKVPVGHCNRIHEVRVFASGDGETEVESETMTEPDVRRGVSCGSNTDGGTFAVSIDHYDETVTANETVTLTATVENVGETETTQDVRFLVDGEQIDGVENLTLPANRTEELSFVYETAPDDVPAIEIAVESDDEADERTVIVNEPDPAFFVVSIENASAEVAAGETVDVTARVENTGDRVGTQNVTLTDFDGKTVDTAGPLTLSANGSTSVSLAWATENTDVGTGNVTIRSDNETDTAAVTVDQPAVESIDATLEAAEIETGEETVITVVATFTDASTRDVTENATLTALDTDVATVVDDGTVTAEGNGTTEIEAAFGNETDADTLTVTAADSDDSDQDGSDNDGDNETEDGGGEDDVDEDEDEDGDTGDGNDDSDPDGTDADDGDTEDDDNKDEDGADDDDNDGGNGDSDPDGSDADDGDSGDESDTEDDGNGDENGAPAQGGSNAAGDNAGTDGSEDVADEDTGGENGDSGPDGSNADDGDADTDGGEDDADEADAGEANADENDADADEADGTGETDGTTGETDGTSTSSIVVSPILGLLFLVPLLAKRQR